METFFENQVKALSEKTTALIAAFLKVKPKNPASQASQTSQTSQTSQVSEALKITIPQEFREEFFSLVDKVSLSLMADRDNFYGYFLMQMARDIRFDISSPTAVNFKGAQYVIYFNPAIFLELNLKQMESTIKHEILHIVSLHLIRAQELKTSYSTLAINTAMNIVVNTYLDHLPPYSVTLEWANLHYSLNLLPFKPFEYYAQELQTALDLLEAGADRDGDNDEDRDNGGVDGDGDEDENEDNGDVDRAEDEDGDDGDNGNDKGDGAADTTDNDALDKAADNGDAAARAERDTADADNSRDKTPAPPACDRDNLIKTEYHPEKDHDIWAESSAIDQKTLQEFTEKFIDNAQKGSIPGYLSNMISALKNSRPELPWQLYLKGLMGTVESHKKKTITRRNRRQPQRLDLRGELRSHKARIAVALDISGSISDQEFNQAMQEVLGIVKHYPHELTIIECDSEIRRAYQVKSAKDLRDRLRIRGGTQFSPVFTYANRHKVNLLIYFTDGQGEEKLRTLPRGYQTLWVISGKGDKLSLKETYGAVKKLKPTAVNDENASLKMSDVKQEGFSMNDQEGMPD